MGTDITLDDRDGDQVTIRANVLKAEGSDFILDSPARRQLAAATAGHLRDDSRQHGGHYRRALVHDQHDGLTLNYAGDYPGGITLHGVASITPKKGNVVIKGGIELKGGIEFEMFSGEISGTDPHGLPILEVKSVNLAQIIADLKVEVNNLKARIAALEAKG